MVTSTTRRIAKWLLIAVGGLLGLLVLGLVGLRLHAALVMNPEVAAELHGNPHGARAARTMLLTLPDGREIPVNFLREGDQVFAGADGFWWREFRDGGVPVTLYIQGQTLQGRARTVLDDPAYTRRVFERLRPDVPEWLPEWLDAYLVVIDLDS